MRISIRVFFISFFALLLVVVFYGAYSYFVQLEVPLWILQYTFYAFMTAIFGFIFLGILAPLIRDRLETGKMKKVKTRSKLMALKDAYSGFQSHLDKIFEKSVNKNQLVKYTVDLSDTPDMGELRVSEALQRDIQRYNEELMDYNIFLKASDGYIKSSIEKKVRRMFPKTLEQGIELDNLLLADFFMSMYLNREPVTCNWLRDTQPILLRNINKQIDDAEKYELDVLFNEINNEFEKEEILLRLEKQMNLVTGHRMKIAENLKKEIGLLDKKLEKYDYLRIVEATIATKPNSTY